MSKRFGIKTHHRDDVSGDRESWDTEKWYPTEEERDLALQQLKAGNRRSNRPKDVLLQLDIEADLVGEGYDVETYSPIEEEV